VSEFLRMILRFYDFAQPSNRQALTSHLSDDCLSATSKRYEEAKESASRKQDETVWT